MPHIFSWNMSDDVKCRLLVGSGDVMAQGSHPLVLSLRTLACVDVEHVRWQNASRVWWATYKSVLRGCKTRRTCTWCDLSPDWLRLWSTCTWCGLSQAGSPVWLTSKHGHVSGQMINSSCSTAAPDGLCTWGGEVQLCNTIPVEMVLGQGSMKPQ